MTGLRIGVDLGGTKVAAVGLDDTDWTVAHFRESTPREDYDATVRTIAALVRRIEEAAGRTGTVGVGIPGSLSPTGLVQNANSTWLNGRPLDRDLEQALGREIRLANDANCFALSEAHDGSAEGASSVFGVILGTGCGGGLVIEGCIVKGAQGIGGEWGHTPLPWARSDEHPGPECWCGRRGCMETWVSGPGLARDHKEHTGEAVGADTIVARARSGDLAASASLARHQDRLARGLAMVIDIVDPEMIVLGGGLSQLEHLYETLPELIAPHVFSDSPSVRVVPPGHGDASGVRGAARLW